MEEPTWIASDAETGGMCWPDRRLRLYQLHHWTTLRPLVRPWLGTVMAAACYHYRQSCRWSMPRIHRRQNLGPMHPCPTVYSSFDETCRLIIKNKSVDDRWKEARAWRRDHNDVNRIAGCRSDLLLVAFALWPCLGMKEPGVQRLPERESSPSDKAKTRLKAGSRR